MTVEEWLGLLPYSKKIRSIPGLRDLMLTLSLCDGLEKCPGCSSALSQGQLWLAAPTEIFNMKYWPGAQQNAPGLWVLVCGPWSVDVRSKECSVIFFLPKIWILPTFPDFFFSFFTRDTEEPKQFLGSFHIQYFISFSTMIPQKLIKPGGQQPNSLNCTSVNGSTAAVNKHGSL